MIAPFARTLCTALGLMAANFPAKAQTNAVLHEEILVKAPFAMPAIKVPVFPKMDFNVSQYGAKEGGDISEAIRKAIAACHDAGGGRVVIPAGKWKTGKIHFQSNVNLHLEKEARLTFSGVGGVYFVGMTMVAI